MADTIVSRNLAKNPHLKKKVGQTGTLNGEEGRFEQRGNTLVFLPSNVMPSPGNDPLVQELTQSPDPMADLQRRFQSGDIDFSGFTQEAQKIRGATEAHDNAAPGNQFQALMANIQQQNATPPPATPPPPPGQAQAQQAFNAGGGSDGGGFKAFVQNAAQQAGTTAGAFPTPPPGAPPPGGPAPPPGGAAPGGPPPPPPGGGPPAIVPPPPPLRGGGGGDGLSGGGVTPPSLPPAQAGGTIATGAPAAPGINPMQKAAIDQLQQYLGSQNDMLSGYLSTAQEAEGQRRSQAMELDRQLEDFLGQRLNTNGPDQITQSRLADFEAQGADQEAQLRENMQRLGLLTSGGDTVDQFANFAGQQERTRQGILGEGQARQDQAFNDALGLLQSRRQDLGLQGDMASQDRNRALQQILGVGGLDLQQQGLDLQRGQALGSIDGQDTLQNILGTGQLGNQTASIANQLRLGLTGQETARRGQDIQQELGLGNIGVNQGRLDMELGDQKRGDIKDIVGGGVGLLDFLTSDAGGGTRNLLGQIPGLSGLFGGGGGITEDAIAEVMNGAGVSREQAVEILGGGGGSVLGSAGKALGLYGAGQGLERLGDVAGVPGSKGLGDILGGAGTGAAIGSIIPGIGTLAGGAIGGGLSAGKKLFGKIFSDEDLKDLAPVEGDSLLAILEGVEVPAWRYKGDTETHVGPTAQDFSKFVGDNGDRPRTIDLADYLGVTLGAVKELAKKQKQPGWFEGEGVA